jgi:hypothetical protein
VSVTVQALESGPEWTIERFENGDIDPERFDHEAHVYIGWLYVQNYELAEAITKFDSGLKRLVAKLGADGKYHATLTWFFLLLIADRAQDDQSWLDFRQRNTDLIANSKELLSRYYSDDFLFSKRARERFVLPDRLAANK